VEDFIEPLLTLIAVGIAGLLIMLRIDAERFGTAEYYEATAHGERPRIGRRLGWYILALVGVVALANAHPDPERDLFLGSGDRLGAVFGGLAYGGFGIALAAAWATYRYHRIRLPDTASYPGALLNSTVTALVDEVAFRGAVFGLLLVVGIDATLANLLQTLIYVLSTRLAAPGRDRSLLALAFGIGFVGGWLTAVTGGIAAAFLGHAITRFAVFLCTGHVGQAKPRGREIEEIEKRRRPPDGWRVIGSREQVSRER
jgi:hypothetical protein